LHDLKEFMLVLLVVLGMFSIMFFILHADDSHLADDGDQLDWNLADARPFHSPFFSFLSVYQMIMGQFEVEWYQAESPGLTACSVLLFLVFMFFVVVVMLNVLIAIVSDSYDYALTRSEKLFLRARLVLVAELDALGLTKTDFLPPLVDKWLQKANKVARRGTGGALSLGALFRLQSKDSGGGIGKSSVGTEWTGRVLHMERSTEAIVDEHVKKGVAAVLDKLAAQAQRLKALEAKLSRQAADQAKRDASLADRERDAARQAMFDKNSDQFKKSQFEQKLLETIKAAAAAAFAQKK
jgi:hypothetical protein